MDAPPNIDINELANLTFIKADANPWLRILRTMQTIFPFEAPYKNSCFSYLSSASY